MIGVTMSDNHAGMSPRYNDHHPRYVRLVGTVRVPLTGPAAFRLFTPLGEKVWAQGWDPHFAAPVEDDSRPGTVFEVAHDDVRSVWVVCRRDPDRLIQYARLIPGKNAGTITVTLETKTTESVATVEYALTALTDTATTELARFASHYPQYLAHWETAIAYACAEGSPQFDSQS
jgi:hypothetical protein